MIGSRAHRDIARRAVRESLVLLKNERQTLPLRAGSRILVTGDGANDFMRQSGGWTLTWQGTGLTPADFPGATSIWTGLARAAEARGGTAQLSPDGGYDAVPDAAIVVFGEKPYAEFQGDVGDLLYRDTADNLEKLRRYRAAGIPTVAVFLSGRPLWVNPYINAADAFVAAWLPGSEGDGVAEVLFGQYDFKGRLSFSWPNVANGEPLNWGDTDYKPLFPLNYGLTYTRHRSVPTLSEISGLADGAAPLAQGQWLIRGRAAAGLELAMGDGGARQFDAARVGNTPVGEAALMLQAFDFAAQEDAIRAQWTGSADLGLGLVSRGGLDIARETSAELSLVFQVRALKPVSGPVYVTLGCGETCGARFDIAPALKALPEGWHRMVIPLSCFARQGADMSKLTVPFWLSTAQPADLAIAQIGLQSVPDNARTCPAAASPPTP